MAWSSVSGLGNRFRSVLVHLSPRGKGPTLSRVGRASRYTRSLCHLSPYLDPADQARLYWVVDREAIQHRGLLLRQWWSEWRGVEKVTVGMSAPIDVGVDDFRHIAPAIHIAALKTPRLSRVRPGASVGIRIALQTR